jgi:tetratricopeptide (TPR) repeat protein
LTQKECERLLLKIGQQYGEEEQIKEIINNHPGRVEALRRLTGGVPRTISYLFQIFLDNENGKAIKDLYLLIDTLGLLYKSELDQLSTQQQKVVDSIARNWDAISVKEIVKRTRLESKNVSSILAYLEKNQVIEKVPTSTKNHLYRIKERFMNIWYLMRFGRKHDKDNVIWLVRFFDAWCDESELTKRIKRHIDNLKDGKYDLAAAIDMRNTFLSCENISASLKEELIRTTNSILPKRLLKGANNSQQEVLKDIKDLIKGNKHAEAIELLERVEDKNIDYYMLATSIYLTTGEYSKALAVADSALKKDDSDPYVLISAAVIYDVYLRDTEKAVELYKKCLNLPQPHPYAANRLGDIARQKQEYEEAIRYHTQAISKNFKQSLLDLGKVYFDMGEYEKAESYFKDAIEENVEGAYTSLAKLLKKTKRKADARLALKTAVKANEPGSNITLGRDYLLQKKPNYQKAELQFREAIERGATEGYNQLARLYAKKGEIDRAIAEYEAGISSGNAESAHELGHLYVFRNDFAKADEMFSKAIELGNKLVVCCWVESIYRAYRKDKKLMAIELLQQYRQEKDKESLSIDLLFAKILLWNDEIAKSERIVLNCIKELARSHNDINSDEKYIQQGVSELLEYFLLLIAKGEVRLALSFFENDSEADLKVMLKPIYYLIMEDMKDEFPSEYLKAGKELEETVNELQREVKKIKENI